MGLRVTKGEGMTRVVAEGEFSRDEIEETFSRIREDHSSLSPLRILIHDEGSHFDPGLPEVRGLVRVWAEIFDGMTVRIALLVARDAHFGIGRQLSVFTDESPVILSVFRDRPQALAWLESSAPAA